VEADDEPAPRVLFLQLAGRSDRRGSHDRRLFTVLISLSTLFQRRLPSTSVVHRMHCFQLCVRSQFSSRPVTPSLRNLDDSAPLQVTIPVDLWLKKLKHLSLGMLHESSLFFCLLQIELSRRAYDNLVRIVTSGEHRDIIPRKRCTHQR
jgi:hypothetical protein